MASDDAPLPDWLAELDQMLKGIGDFANILASYHRELVSGGFTRDEALQIVLGYQAMMLTPTDKSDDDDG